MTDITDIKNLSVVVTCYWDIQKTRIGVENRLRTIDDPILHSALGALEDAEKSLKKSITTRNKKQGIWNWWLKDVRGVGEVFSAQLISLIHGQVHTPECTEKRDAYFAKKDKDEDKRAESYECDCPILGMERFPNVSSLWKYAGMDVRDGKAPKRAKGQKITWNPRLRSVCYNIGKSFVMVGKGGVYRAFYDKVKAEEVEKHPELTKGHIDARARRKVVKLFLSHLFAKWYEMEGLEAPMPYIHTVGGHTNYIPPQ